MLLNQNCALDIDDSHYPAETLRLSVSVRKRTALPGFDNYLFYLQPSSLDCLDSILFSNCYLYESAPPQQQPQCIAL